MELKQRGRVKVYKCPYCSAIFEFQQDLQHHIRERHPTKSYTSLVGGEESGNSSRRIDNWRQDSNERIDVRDHDERQHDRSHRIQVQEYDGDSSSFSESEYEDEDELSTSQKLESFKAKAVPLSRKRRDREWNYLQNEMSGNLDSGEFVKNTKGYFAKIKRTSTDAVDFINRFALWENNLRKIEGRFGSGVYNFFKFMKWAMGLNLFMTVLTVLLISVPEHFNDEKPPECNVTDFNNMTMFLPEDVDGCCSAIYNLNQEWNRD